MERIEKYDSTKVVKPSDNEAMNDAAEHLRNGEVVGFPTETVYGLGANALDKDAVDKIFEAKGRPGDNPLIVHISSKDQISELVTKISPLAQKLINSFMPGPITIIMPKSDKIPSNVTAGLDSVGIRMPIHKVANDFLTRCACPVAAPSANLSGSPSPTKASHVYSDMNKYIYAIIDGGDSDYGLESTVVDATGEYPVILRPGAITKAQIEEVCGIDSASKFEASSTETPKAPGMKYRHYAPGAEVRIINLPEDTEILGDTYTLKDSSDEDKESELSEEDELENEKIRQAMFDIAKPYILTCKEILSTNPTARIGLFCGAEVKELFDALNDSILSSHVHFFIYGFANDVDKASHYLFDGLRTLDIQGVDVILAAGFMGEGMSQAYMNRLNKASVKSGEVTSSMKINSARGETIHNFESMVTTSVLFVCNNNRTLSAAAEGVFRRLLRQQGPFCLENARNVEVDVYCESAGIYAVDGEKADKNIVKALDEIGISMGHHLTQRACASIYDQNDLILTMRDEQADEIINAFPELKGRVFSLSSYLAAKGMIFKDDKGRVISLAIPNPEGETFATYQHTAKALDAWLKVMFPYILKDLGAELA